MLDCRWNLNVFEVWRLFISDVNNERIDKLEDSLDLLLKRFWVENFVVVKEIFLMGEFCVYMRMLEVGYLLRFLGVRREMRSLWVD